MNHLPIRMPASFVLVTACFLTTALTAVGQNPGHVILANGDKLPARIVSLDDKSVTFGSPLFKEQVTLAPRLLRSVRFHRPGEDSDRGRFVFLFKSGTRLEGRLLKLDNKECQFFSQRLGEVSVPVASLLEIQQLESESSVTKWSATSPAKLATTLRSDPQGRIIVAAKQPPVVVPEPIEGVGTFEIEFQVTDKTEFQILLAAKPGKVHTRIGVSNGSIIVETADDVGFGEFPIIGGMARLRLSWLKDSLHVQNHVGHSLVELKHDGKATTSILVRSEGEPLHIGEMSVDAKPTAVVPNQLATTHAIIWSKNAGTEVSSVQILNDVVSQKNSDGSEITYPIADLRRIWVGHSETATEPSNTRQYACLWEQGDRVMCGQVALSDGKATFESSEFVSTGAFRTLPTEVFFPPTSVPSSGRSQVASTFKLPMSESPFRLSVGGVPYSGAYSWGDAANPIRWQFKGFKEPVTLNVARRIEISRIGRTPSVNLNASDRLLLKDGSIVPCRIATANKKTFRLASDQTATTAVAALEIQSCFFDVADTLWRSAITNEAVRRALTLPRSSRDMQFTHVLIGRNGDLLRGNLIAIHDGKVEFESRLEPLLIDRENVVGIISVDSLKTATDESVASGSSVTEKKLIAQIDCGNSFVAVGQYVSLSDESAVVNSPVLGKLTIPVAQIRGVTFNGPTDSVSPLQAFSGWQVATASDPRWDEKLAVAANANELLNQPAPDFEMPLLDAAGRNEAFRISDHLGKIVVLNFWTASSKPSVLGMPEYLKVLRKFSPDDVVFVAINPGEPASQVANFISSNKWGFFKSICDTQSEIASKYNVTAIPHLAIIDPQGYVRIIKVGYSRTAATDLANEIKALQSLPLN